MKDKNEKLKIHFSLYEADEKSYLVFQYGTCSPKIMKEYKTIPSQDTLKEDVSLILNSIQLIFGNYVNFILPFINTHEKIDFDVDISRNKVNIDYEDENKINIDHTNVFFSQNGKSGHWGICSKMNTHFD
jgi:predicted RNA-binding protein Jag